LSLEWLTESLRVGMFRNSDSGIQVFGLLQASHKIIKQPILNSHRLILLREKASHERLLTPRNGPFLMLLETICYEQFGSEGPIEQSGIPDLVHRNILSNFTHFFPENGIQFPHAKIMVQFIPEHL
jgi:hypothetical protein